MSRFKSIIAAAIIPAVLVAAPAFAKISGADKKEIQSIVADYLQNNPQVIISALQEFQRKQMQQAEETIKDTQKDASKFAAQLFRSKGDPVGGNPNGSVTLVEFFDYQCPHCVDMLPVINEAIKANPNLRVVFKEFPIRGPLSGFASRAALAANLQGKYMEFHDALMATKQPYTEASIMEAAQKAGLNVDKLKTDMESSAIKSQLDANSELAQKLKLLGTPAFFIGKTDATASGNIQYIPGVISAAKLSEVVKKFE